MFRRLYPSEDTQSIYDIDFRSFHERGYNTVLFDIDNTLVEHGAPATERVIDFFKDLHGMGYETCLISNNKEPRVKPFADAVGSKYVYDAHKPSRKNYIRAMELMGTDTGNTYFIGDQIFTDVYGANRAGIPSILVKPIHPKEEIQIVLKRKLEKIVLFCYKRRKK